VDRLIEETNSTGARSRTVAEISCVACGRPLSHLFRPDDESCWLCPEDRAGHEGLPQGSAGWLYCVRREHDDATTLVFIWCLACAETIVGKNSHITFIRTLFAAVPDKVRDREVVTASVRRRFQN
jgi:hypothetical protein